MSLGIFFFDSSTAGCVARGGLKAYLLLFILLYHIITYIAVSGSSIN
jgi:hypothetical protein